tara:strand:+ start:275 stop:532 length:258 start_codon:yes stop_codon:yes gene_type:complete
MKREDSIIVPVLNENLTLLTFLVPKDFASQIETRAMKILEAAEKENVEIDESNQFVQVMSFVLQTAVHHYLDQHPDGDIQPPEIL